MLPEHNHFATTLQLFPSQTSSSGPKYLIFNITGNPGLIAYYTQFLTSLRNRLESTAPKAEFEIYSRSLSGFDVNDHKADDSYGVEHAIKEQDRSRPPFSLEAQIEHAIIALKQVVAASSREANGKEPSVILVGHSVGTYMILEIISRLRTNAAKDGYHSTINVVGGICLFATVTHLAQSKSGKIFSVSYIPIPR